jgi:disulfide bond formation protein DsbB
MPNNRTLLLAIAFICFAVIGGALYFQHVKLMAPCGLCVFQRYAFVFAGSFALAAAFTTKPKPWIALSLVSALAGIGTVAKHLYVLANPGFSCGIDPATTFLNKIPTATLLPSVFEAEGLCETAGDLIMGLSLPQWSGVTFVAVSIALVFALVRRRA